MRLPTYFRPSGIPEDHFFGLVGNFFPEPVFPCQIDDLHPLSQGHTDPWGIAPVVKIPGFDVLRGLTLGYEHRFHFDWQFKQKTLPGWPGRIYLLQTHADQAPVPSAGNVPTDKENITAKARRTQIEDGRRKREEGSKRKDYHFWFFEKAEKIKRTLSLREH
jgi:hypothetical protein